MHEFILQLAVMTEHSIITDLFECVMIQVWMN